jgi:hypothetical protein
MIPLNIYKNKNWLFVLLAVSALFGSCNKGASSQTYESMLQYKWVPISTTVIFPTNASLNCQVPISDADYLNFSTDGKLYSYNASNLYVSHYDTSFYSVYDSSISCTDFQIQSIFQIPLNSGIAPLSFKIESIRDNILVLSYPLPYDTTINGNITSFTGIVVDSLKR